MVSNKQKQEIDFLTKFFDASPTARDIKEYIEWTVRGIKPKDGTKTQSKNSLFHAKRRLDMNIKMWTEDMQKGQLAYWELEEDFNHPYLDKVVSTIRKSMHPLPEYDGNLGCATLGWLNSKFNK